MEGYLVDDLKGMVTNGKGQKLNGRFVVFDIETTGFFFADLSDHRDWRRTGRKW